MSKLITAIAFAIICNICFGYSNKQLHIKAVTIDTTTNLIMQLDFDSFRGKPIDSFLVKIPQNYSSIQMYGAGFKGPFRLIIEYPNDNYIVVYVQHPICCVSNPHARPSQWSLTEFKMEKAGDITLYNREGCLKGCHPDTEYN